MRHQLRAIWVLVIINVSLTLAWALARVPIMNDANYSHVDRSIEPWGDALYHSAVTQSTLGVMDVRPKSRKAQVITAVQALLSYVLNIVLWIGLLETTPAPA